MMMDAANGIIDEGNVDDGVANNGFNDGIQGMSMLVLLIMVLMIMRIMEMLLMI